MDRSPAPLAARPGRRGRGLLAVAPLCAVPAAARHCRRTLLGAALLAAAVGCGGEPAPGEPAPVSSGHERMVAELAAIAAEVIPGNRFLGDEELRRQRDELARLGPDGDLAARVELCLRMAVAELRLGRPRDALALLADAEALLPRLPGVRRESVAAQRLYAEGMAWLRVAETSNCIGHHTSRSCLLPIEGDGVHVDSEGSRRAAACFTRLLEEPSTPPALVLRARWLLSLAAMTLGEYPDGVPEAFRIPPEVFASDEPFPRFEEVAARVGLARLNLSGGAAVDDFDGDGLLDVITSVWDYAGPMSYFRNRGDGTFVDRADEAGLTGLTGGLNLTHADVDDDGDLDVLVLRGAWFDDLGCHPDSLLLNDGQGRFRDHAYEAGIAEPAYPGQAGAFADFDADGDLDLYLGNESSPRSVHPCQLYENLGDGTFRDVAQQAGVQNLRYAKGASWGDVDGDGDPDLYVSNLGADNRLYENRGDGTFVDTAPERGVVGPCMSFATWFWDFDNDGALDIYCAAYVEDIDQNVASRLGLPHEAQSGRLYRNDGRGGFADVGEQRGLDLLATTMGSNFGDLDNDGWLDLYLGTGYPSYEGLLPNVMYRNVEGRRFADVTSAGGFGHLQKGHAVAFADVDNDGDQDVFEQMGGAFLADVAFNALYENPGNAHHWVRLHLVGRQSNRSAIGARVQLDLVEPAAGAPGAGGPGGATGEGTPPRRRSIHRHVTTGGSFGSNPLHVHVGLGPAARIERLTVWWPTSGRRQVFEDVAADRFLQIREGDDTLVELPRRIVELRRE